MQNNVVSLADYKKSQEKREMLADGTHSVNQFHELIQKNRQMEEKLREERNKSNKAILNSHNLKK